ncbi:MAG TPA: DUF5681 domain-containing protein [Tepidisphaeraceae bacterium]|jgi:hypothetical protein
MTLDPDQQAGNAGRGPGTPPPPVEHRFKPGQSGNPSGRPKNAGQSLRECINDFVAQQLTEDALRRIARGKDESIVRRAAAERLLRTVEYPDMADFEEVLAGRETLREARERGLNTGLVRKAKRRTIKTQIVGGEKDGSELETEFEVEVELHDRSGTDFDRVSDRTDGRPTQALRINATVDHSANPTVSADLPNDPAFRQLLAAYENRLLASGGSGAAPDEG